MDNNWDQIREKLIGLKGLASIGFADIVGTGISSVFWLYIAATIGPESYGKIQYFIGIAGITSYIALFGTQETIIVYTTKNVKIQSTFYLISLIAGMVASLIVILVFYRIDVGMFIFGYIINTLVIGDLLGRKLYSSYSKYVLTQKILTLVLGIGFFYVFGVNSIIYALALSYGPFIIRVFKVFKEIKIDFSLLKPRLGFIINNYALLIVKGLAGQLDKLIIAPLLGFMLLGNYSLALQIIGVLLIFPEIMFKYFLPHDSSGNMNKRLKKITVLISICVTIGSVTLSPYIIPTMFPKYLGVVSAIQIMSVGIIPSTIAVLYISKFLGLEKSKFVLLGSLFSVITTILGIITLGGILGVNGLALSFLLSVLVKVIFLAGASMVVAKRET